MVIAKDMGNVRIVYDGSPFDVLYDIKVERLVGGECKMYKNLLAEAKVIQDAWGYGLLEAIEFIVGDVCVSGNENENRPSSTEN